MKVYTFEIGRETYEFYDLRKARKRAREVSKETNAEVLITCTHKPSYNQDWYTVFPDGTFVTDMKGFKANN
jgi:hypothetical protein